MTTTASGDNFVVGESAGQSGSYAISGGTLQFGPNANAFIGASGTGTMTQTGGEVTANGFAVIGRYSGGVGNYTISAGSLNQAAADRLLIVGEEGTGTLTVSDTGSVTSAGGISIAHAAGGVGTVNLDGGTISASSVFKGSGSTATFNFNGGTLGATGNNANFMSGLDVAEIKAGGAVIDDAGFEIGIGQVLSGTGALEKTGSGRLTLSGNNTYAGTTTISEGNLRVGNDGTTGTLGSGNVVNNATLAFARSDALTVSQEISGTGEVRKWGFGTTTFTGANTFSGDFLQEYGVTVLNRTCGPALYADGGAGEVVIANLSGGANSYSAVEMGSADQLGSNVDVTFSPQDIADGYSYLSLHGNDTTIGNLKSTANHAAAWGIVQNQESGSFGDSTLTIHQTVDGSFTGEIRDGFGDNVGRLALVKEGAATLTLDSAGGVGLSYSGGTTVNGGTLVIGDTLLNTGNALTVNNGATVTFAHDNVLGVHTATITMPIALNDGGLLQNSGAVFNALGALTLNGGTLQANAVEAGSGQSFALKGAVTVTGNATSTIAGNGIALGAASVTGTTFNVGDGTAATDLLVTGVLRDGSGAAFGPTQVSSLTKTGAGAMVLTGSNTYTGTTTISAGTLQVGDGGTSGNLGTGNVVNNGALAFNRSDSHSISNVISGTGSLTKNGSGVTALTGNNTYSGTTTVSAGTLQVGDGGTSGSLGTGEVVNNGTLSFNRSEAFTVSNDISGSGDLIQQGSGTLSLSSRASYVGLTRIESGTLALLSGASIENSSEIRIDNGARFDVSLKDSGYTVLAGQTLSGGGTVEGAITVEGTHTPGFSPGLQTFENGLSYASDATFVWELIANSSATSDRGVNFDAVDVNGAGLNFAPGVTAELVFNLDNSEVAWSDVFWGSEQSWLVFDSESAEGSASVTAIFETVNLSADSTGAELGSVAGRENAFFQWRQDGNDIYLDYSPVPEPASYAALFGLLALGWASTARRRCRC